VQHGGSQAQAARRFDLSLWCVRDWLARKYLQPQQKGIPRKRKLDKEALRAHVRNYPDALIRDGRCILASIPTPGGWLCRGLS